MSPGAHLLASWLLANSALRSQRERRLVALAGLAPDLDGLGWLVDRTVAANGGSSDYYFAYHHLILHNLPASLALAGLAAWLAATCRWRTFALALLAIHLHFLLDVIGSKGPDGYQWPIPYLLPFTPDHAWTWSGQWELDAWPNLAITLAMLAIAGLWSWKCRYSFIEVISTTLDREFFKIVARHTRRHPDPAPPL